MPAYRLQIPDPFRRAIESFPAEVRSELQVRLENVAALPLSAASHAGGSHSSTVDVEGYKAVVELDAGRNVVNVIKLFSPADGWIQLPRSA